MTETPSPSAQTSSETAHGHGLATIASDGTVLDVWFPQPVISGTAPDVPSGLGALEQSDDARKVQRKVVSVSADLTQPPADAADAYLRLHVISHRLKQPNTINLEGIFGKLANVVWTNFGPAPVADFETTRLALFSRGSVTVYGVDKFPRLVDYVLPTGVRIADADRVRLGAHLAEGTTVMHEGFVNFNAGTLGTSMVEGRISAGVVVGNGTDVGGGASIMGTLSGGGTQKISLGERCLLGANSGVGISLGDDSVVEAGLYVTAGTRVTLPAISNEIGSGQHTKTVKALELSGVKNLLFRRNSTTGVVEAIPRSGQGIVLNEALHHN